MLPKPVWEKVLGAEMKATKLKLNPQEDGIFLCPVNSCDSEPYHNQRSCRKHVNNRHGWYYYFDTKPDI